MSLLPKPPMIAAFALFLGAGAWFSSSSVASKVPDFVDASKRHAPVIAPAMPGALTLFEEPVPLEAFGVREALDRELVVNTYRHSSTILYLKRATRWFPIIEPILEEEGVPVDFKYLAVIESGRPGGEPAGASGFWQFMKRTAPEYGKPATVTSGTMSKGQAACTPTEAHTRFGSWVLMRRPTTWADRVARPSSRNTCPPMGPT